MKQSKEVPLTIVTVQLESKNKKTYSNSNTYHHEFILFIASKVNIYTDKQTQTHMTHKRVHIHRQTNTKTHDTLYNHYNLSPHSNILS